MSEKEKAEGKEESRRDFLKEAGKVAVTAPAVTLLLSRPAQAVPDPYQIPI